MRIASVILSVVLLALGLTTSTHSSETRNRWLIGNEPKELPKIPKGVSWTELLERSLDDFVGTPDAYRRWSKQLPSIMTAYGVLQTSNGVAWKIFYFDGYYKKPSTPDSTRSIFRSESLRQTFYAWAMPVARRAFSSLPKGDQEEYLRILEHASRYLAGFNTAAYQAEVLYLTELEQSKCRDKNWLESRNIKLPEWAENPTYQFPACRDFFTWFDPKGVKSPYRKIEAFAFRRTKEGVDAQTQKYWVDRVIADLRSVAK